MEKACPFFDFRHSVATDFQLCFQLRLKLKVRGGPQVGVRRVNQLQHEALNWKLVEEADHTLGDDADEGSVEHIFPSIDFYPLALRLSSISLSPDSPKSVGLMTQHVAAVARGASTANVYRKQARELFGSV